MLLYVRYKSEQISLFPKEKQKNGISQGFPDWEPMGKSRYTAIVFSIFLVYLRDFEHFI